MDKIYFTDTQIMSLTTDTVDEFLPKMTKDGSSVSVFGTITVIASPYDKKLISVDEKGETVVIDYSNKYVHFPNTKPFAITHDSKGKLYMLRWNYRYGVDSGTIARFSDPRGLEETKEAEVVWEQPGVNSSVVVNGDFVYFTATEWARNETEHKWGRSIWRLPLDFTDASIPEEVFNLEDYAPGFYDCRGLAFDSSGNLYFTSANVPFDYWRYADGVKPSSTEAVGTIVKVNLATKVATVVKDQLVEPKEVAIVDNNLVVDTANKFVIYTKTGTVVKDVAAGDITAVVISAEFSEKLEG